MHRAFLKGDQISHKRNHHSDLENPHGKNRLTMGSLCSKQDDAIDKGRASIVKSMKIPRNKEAALNFFDAEQDTENLRRDMLESLKIHFSGSVYFDALDEMVESKNDNSEDPLLYPPASVACKPSLRSVRFENDASLLKEGKRRRRLNRREMGNSLAVMKALQQQPSRKVISAEGYPGSLTVQELEACKEFRQKLKTHEDSDYKDMVVSNMAPFEDEAFSICRFMRARNFEVDAVLEFVGEGVPMWKDAAEHDFYPSCEQAVGHPQNIFYTQFPSVFSGMANNGTITNFMRVGVCEVPGIQCLVDLSKLSNYYWYHAKTRVIEQALFLEKENPDAFVRCEETYVVDVKGLTLTQVSSVFVDSMKSMFKPTACFPEMLNKAIILNAPSFFSFIWRIVRMFLHPRTTNKVEIYSHEKSGLGRLRQLFDPKDIPADYGGELPYTFHELAEQKYCGKGCRQAHKLMSAVINNWDFELKSDEIASVRVYTKSAAVSEFTISCDADNSKPIRTTVQPNGRSGPYSEEVASKLSVPANYKVSLSCHQRDEHFLVVASISSTKAPSSSDAVKYVPASAPSKLHRGDACLDNRESMLLSSKESKVTDNTSWGIASVAIMDFLQQPENRKVPAAGYPGNLTEEELDICQKFRLEIKSKDPAYGDMVRALVPAEEEPYAICRFLRARNFIIEDTITMMDEAIDMWKAAAAESFYPTAEHAVGHSESVFYTQFPNVFTGPAHNGTIVNFMRAGSLCVPGIECLTDLDNLPNYYWFDRKNRMVQHVQDLQEANPDVYIRFECLNIVDLEGLTMAQATTALRDTCAAMTKPSACFPELLNKQIMLNAPSFFSWIWRLAKMVIPPATAAKIEIFSDEARGLARLKELIDPKYIPADYDGDMRHTFHELAEQKYCGKGCRQVHELMSSSTTEFEFELKEKETAIVSVYTRSSSASEITVSSKNDNSPIKATIRPNGRERPYSDDIASGLKGAGTYTIALDHEQDDHFLVIVKISQTE